jgi:predicted nucleic acid-binding protein
LPTNADPLLLDTSAAMAKVDLDNPLHPAIEAAVAGRRLGLSGHAAFEFFSVVTRLPPPKRQSEAATARLMAREFPESRWGSAEAAARLVDEFAAEGVGGGAVYDALVAAAAREHGLVLVSCDVRARATYAAMGVDYLLVR